MEDATIFQAKFLQSFLFALDLRATCIEFAVESGYIAIATIKIAAAN